MNRNSIVLASCVVLRCDSLLIVRNDRGSEGDAWTLPSGHVEKDERIEMAAARELKEETGLLCECTPVFEFVLHVRKADHVILNFVFSVDKVLGSIRYGCDPDGIAVEARFVKFGEALQVISYPDVRYALERWRRKEHEHLMHVDLVGRHDA